MIIRIFLLLALSSIISLLAADVAARISLTQITSSLTQLGIALMLIAFNLLVLKVLLALFKSTILSVTDYFSAQNSNKRRFLYFQAKRNQSNRLFYFKTLQIRYFAQHEINRLLIKDNQRQLKSLSQAIQKDIQLKQNDIPATTFKQLQCENRTYLNRQDMEALLKLQQRISTLD